jgi:hypothetical protein
MCYEIVAQPGESAASGFRHGVQVGRAAELDHVTLLMQNSESASPTICIFEYRLALGMGRSVSWPHMGLAPGEPAQSLKVTACRDDYVSFTKEPCLHRFIIIV